MFPPVHGGLEMNSNIRVRACSRISEEELVIYITVSLPHFGLEVPSHQMRVVGLGSMAVSSPGYSGHQMPERERQVHVICCWTLTLET